MRRARAWKLQEDTALLRESGAVEPVEVGLTLSPSHCDSWTTPEITLKALRL